MRRSYYRELKHTRVPIYKVTHNPRYHNFLIGDDLISEKELLFVYTMNGEEVRKVVPMMYIGPHLKKKMFFRDDEFTLRKEFKGTAYAVNDEVIFGF